MVSDHSQRNGAAPFLFLFLSELKLLLQKLHFKVESLIKGLRIVSNMR